MRVTTSDWPRQAAPPPSAVVAMGSTARSGSVTYHASPTPASL